MKKAKVEQTKPIKTRRKGLWITTQMVDDVILVLNIFFDRKLKARHCTNVFTGEYATLENEGWSSKKIEGALGVHRESYMYYYNFDVREMEKRSRMSEEDEQLIESLIDISRSRETASCAAMKISIKEMEYGREKREMAEQRRKDKVNAVMEKVPPVPEDILNFIDQRELNGEEFMMKDRDSGKWWCSHCQGISELGEVKTKNGEMPRNNDIAICPKCGKEVRMLKRKKNIYINSSLMILQPIDKDISVARHFSTELALFPGHPKRIEIEEKIRIILFKGQNKLSPCDIYYKQWGYFDNKGNPQNQRERVCFLYGAGIEEALKDTKYEGWTRVFREMANCGVKADYNRLMVGWANRGLVDVCELLQKGRFEKLLRDTAKSVMIWNGEYLGDLNLKGRSIEEVFKIKDRQKINRIRDKNGGELMVEWMRWSDAHKQKISEKAMTWLLQNNVGTNDMSWMKCRFSIEQAMNYIERQKKESYPGKSARAVIDQYEDYMRMCDRLHKDTADEMVYRPRELKRRHDEAVSEIERRNAELKAEEFSKKFGEAEAVLRQIKKKFEYRGQQFFIMVPDRIVDIVTEGNYLHHCAGATDRYFDRIKQHETYICFLRKVEEPDIPFYTIEVEPGGTIRQHRGMYDEEPNIEEVKPFLREWQKVIRKRMSAEDHERAAVSKVKREENIEDLKAKNNIRVLNGLMEDFMEAVG